ncbi:hypothetical protein Asppvi_008994 [Aspergillus pseudoviridinutans]|uniref:Uncharacterized protein n=1 Tax=Aspergillus pseudoviridinutans TaxID=1517512 RepID=A0A9P3BIP2_9EURO|nr:uncharacterized protein Asppvi_008994 [Aspergillus pseudoviridinutans]GIJ90045.1 hypothetical protein Asppvi_008994 [Aspergillus pseudoviridinutans]
MAATFDFSSKFLSELPPNTPELIAPDIKTIKAALRRQLGQTPVIDFIILSSVPPDAISRLIIDPRAGGDPKPLRMFYNADVRKLIINPPRFPLEIATGYFTRFIMLQTDLCDELIPTGSATVEDGPYAKEPNASYMVEHTLRLRHKWPNYVIETGFEDMLGRLRLHKEWWFGQSDGQVRGVLIVGVSRTARRVVIENWTQRGGSPIKEQEVSISRDEEGVVVVAGDTLRIKFENPFLRPASDDTEGDLVFPREGLEKLAATVWRYLPF